ncbi:MAG: hypothetical protein QM772_13730 [Ottowia sp.]|uniref:hypothetical protein n=1 Tax=Ottowia sp. TaxID=1898956 RepID=UPI0039E30BBD
MDLMIVKDLMRSKSGRVIITGPLLLRGFSRRSEVEQAFGKKVSVSGVGKNILLEVMGVSVSQAMSGDWQVSIMVDYPYELNDIAQESLVSAESG